MNSTLLMDYMNSLISEQTAIKLNQLVLINSGKRTPSNLFTAEKNRLQALFNANYKLSKANWATILSNLTEKNFIHDTDGLYEGTKLGSHRKNDFFQENSIFSDIVSLEFSQTRKDLWTWFVFVSQVLSEHAFDNKRYIPYSSSREMQYKLKVWLKNQNMPVKQLREAWAEEFTAFMASLPEKYRYLLIDQMVGFQKDGLTERQLSEKYELSTIELSIVMDQLMHLMISKNIHSNTLLASLISEVHSMNNYGLSQSATITLKLLDESWTIKDISKKRHIKPNTVKEHILEIVLIKNQLSCSRFIPKESYHNLNRLFLENSRLTYKETMEKLDGVEFFWYRLVEIERMRNDT